MTATQHSAIASIKAMRARYSSELVDAEKRVAAFRAKVQVLDELIQEQREMLAGQAVIEEVAKEEADGANHGSMPTGMTDATLWVVRKYGRATPLTTADIKAHLVANGFKVKGDNYAGMLSITLKRLRAADRVMSEKIDGNWQYRALP